MHILVIKSCDTTALLGTWTGLTSINHHESSLIPSLGTNPVNHEIYILYLGTNVALQIYKTMWACHYPNENREVVLYDHFAGDNSSLEFMIKFRKKNICFFLTSFYATF